MIARCACCGAERDYRSRIIAREVRSKGCAECQTSGRTPIPPAVRKYLAGIRKLDNGCWQYRRVTSASPTIWQDGKPIAVRQLAWAIEPTDDQVERERRLIARCFMGFGSAAHNVKHQTGFRATNQRAHTTPAHDWRNYPANLPAIIERLQGIVIECRDALDVIQQQDAPDTLFYCDPPYVQDTRTSLRWEAEMSRCYIVEMTDDDHRALAEVLRAVDGMVVLSGYRSELYDELFCDWWSTERQAIGDGATARTEVLWLNPAAARSQSQPRLFEGATVG